MNTETSKGIAGKHFFRSVFLAVVLLFAAGWGFTASAEVPLYVQKGLPVIIYPIRTGTVTVYKDSAAGKVLAQEKADELRLTITGFEGNAFRVTYKSGKKKRTGWIPMKKLQYSLTAGKEDALLRYGVSAYRRPSGVNMGTIPGYTDIDILGKKKEWYQIAYPYNNRYYIAWITETDYKKAVRVFDGSERRLMAEGIYTLRPKDSLSQSLTVKKDALTLAAAKKTASQRFEFRFAGENCYQILAGGTTLALSAGVNEEGSYNGTVVLSELSAEEDPGQIWQLVRKGAWYYLKNKGTGLCLTTGTTSFSLKKPKASRPQWYRITMVGKNTSHWQVFSQYDSRWAALKYGQTNTMAASACGVFSSVNAVYALNGQFIDPEELAAYAVKTGYRVEGSGTDYRFVQAAANHFGKTYGYAFAGSTMSLAKLKKHLEKGGTAVVYVPGHYIAVSEYRDGKYLVLDPYATEARMTSPYGCWVDGSRFLSGTLRSQNYLLLKAVD